MPKVLSEAVKNEGRAVTTTRTKIQVMINKHQTEH
jgi:hypothetical protein